MTAPAISPGRRIAAWHLWAVDAEDNCAERSQGGPVRAIGAPGLLLQPEPRASDAPSQCHRYGVWIPRLHANLDQGDRAR